MPRWSSSGAPTSVAQSWRCRTRPPEPGPRSVLACHALGDEDAADLELRAARATFDRLDAAPDLARVEKFLDAADRRGPAELTDRECEVLRLVATGMTNLAIASALTVSQHTVGRHLQNIFTKLGVSSHAATTAYAYEHGIVESA